MGGVRPAMVPSRARNLRSQERDAAGNQPGGKAPEAGPADYRAPVVEQIEGDNDGRIYHGIGMHHQRAAD
jgi:hypothetical protein